MQPAPGKRALTKRRTRRAIRQTAMSLFLDRGFDSVTTTEIAAIAGVSPATLFNYFDTKEDLFFGQVAELDERLIGVVDSCPPGESILRALQAHVLWELTAGRSESDPAAIAPFHEQVVLSSRLQSREHEIFEQREASLSQALIRALPGDATRARAAAHLYVAAERLIAAELRDQLPRVDIDTAMRHIVVFTNEVFDFLDSGVGTLQRDSPP